MIPKSALTKEQALEKIKSYCAYQERCHKEVKEKLYGYGLRSRETNEIIADLIENNYLNEERFALQYAGGRFRMKQWGRKKIIYELQKKGVSSYVIKLALKVVDADYNSTLKKVTLKKWNTLSGTHHLTRQSKTYSYLLQKGFEPALIRSAIAEIITSAKIK